MSRRMVLWRSTHLSGSVMNQTGLTTWQMYRSLALSIYLPALLMSFSQSSILLAIPLFALDLGGSFSIAALVFSLRGLGNMTADVPAGFGVSRFGDKYMMLVGIGMMAVMGIASSQAQSALQLAGAAFFLGCAMAIWLVARITHISTFVADHQRGKAISTMAGLQRFGNLMGPIVSGLVAHQFGFQWVFVLVSVIACIAFVFIAVFVPEKKQEHSSAKPGLLRIVPHILMSHGRTFLTAGMAIFCLSILRASRQLLIPLWGSAIGLNASEIGLITGIAAGADMAMFPLAGYMMDNWGRKHAAVSCMGVIALALVMLPWANSFLTLCLFAVLAGVGNGLGAGINVVLGSDFAPEHERGEFLGVWRLMGDTGSFSAPVLVGLATQTLYLGGVFPLMACFGVVGVFIVVLFVEEPLLRRDK